MIGGYALRAFTTYSRYTRDCDFALKKMDGWNLDKMQKLLPKDLTTEVFEKRGNYGFVRCIKLLKSNGKSAKISIDLMEGEIRGRTEKQVFFINEEFLQKTKTTKIPIARKEIEIHVPNYTDSISLAISSSLRFMISNNSSLLNSLI